MAEVIRESLTNGGKVLICGNGGSLSQANHFAGELLADGLNCVALTNAAAITAVANDNDFELVFGIQVLALGNPGDVLICLTTSNKSKNIHYATKCGAVKQMKVYTVTGNPNDIDPNTTLVVMGIGCSTQYIQEETLKYLHELWRLI